MQNNGRNASTVLVGDEISDSRQYFETALRGAGYSVLTAQDCDGILQHLSERSVDAVLLDAFMPRRGGVSVLQAIRARHADIPVIMVANGASQEILIDAMRQGASDFLVIPVSQQDVEASLERCLSVRPRRADRHAAATEFPPEQMTFCADGQAMQQVVALLGRIKDSDVPVLIQGETGTGKEVIARQLHRQSRRARKPFLKLNCAALPSELVESELFGYERGAFTGAFQRKLGMFELADGGTILLDEIGDMDYKLQAKLLQVLQDKQFQRLGGKETVAVDVRVLAATHRNLEQAISERTFREDLLYRLNVITITLPPLRERLDEIVLLAEYLLRKQLSNTSGGVKLSAMLAEALVEHDWPGNVRELENVMQRLAILGDPEAIIHYLKFQARRCSFSDESRAARFESRQPRPVLVEVNRAKEQAETEAIMAALESTRWNRKEAAALLNIHYKALLYKMKKLSIGSEAARAVNAG